MATRFFWAIVGGFLLGVATRSFLPVGHAFIYLLLFLATVSVFLFSVGRLKIGTLIIPVALVACALGIVRMDIATLSGDPLLTERLDTSVTIEGVVSTEPDVRDNSVRVKIATTKIISPVREPVQVGILAILPAHADIAYGDQVRAWGTLRAPETFDTGVGRQFAYPQYLAAQGITYQLSLAQAEKLRGAPWSGNNLQAAAIWVKQTLLRGMRNALPEPEAGLAGGITVGDKRSIGTELSNVFQDVGIVHMVVLSGYNITVVLNAVVWIFSHMPRLFQYGISGSIITLFILMAGGAASAVRAGLMAIVAVLARATGRMFLAARALALVAVLIVAWDPFELAFDPSFQLSALATLGLIVFTPLFERRLQWIPKRFALREIASSTLGTQITVLPLLLYQNGNLAIYSLPANLLALIAVPPTMFFALVASIGGLFLGPLSVVIAFPAYLLLAYIVGVANFFASLPFAAVSVGAFSVWWMIVAYAVIFSGAWCLHCTTQANGPCRGRCVDRREREGP